MIVSSARQPATVTQPGDTNASTQVVLAQRTRDGATIGRHPTDRLKARSDTKRDNERKAKKRDRHTGKQRNRR